MAELSDPITLRLPLDMLVDIEKIAAGSERTRSWVIVRALKYYLSREAEGGICLSVLRGRDEADRFEQAGEVRALQPEKRCGARIVRETCRLQGDRRIGDI